MKKVIKLTENQLISAINNTLCELGQFNEKSDLKEMARVGYMGKDYEVFVRTDDSGNLPHVHISNESLKRKGVIKHFMIIRKNTTKQRMLFKAYFSMTFSVNNS